MRQISCFNYVMKSCDTTSNNKIRSVLLTSVSLQYFFRHEFRIEKKKLCHERKCFLTYHSTSTYDGNNDWNLPISSTSILWLKDFEDKIYFAKWNNLFSRLIASVFNKFESLVWSLLIFRVILTQNKLLGGGTRL